ncbi:MAG TPA: MFS transporter [Nitrospiraceae bacterium]|nr:MFS transporter [Nitrospiraceae bacterium]
MDKPASSHERNRRYGIHEGAFQAVAQGSGENYLSAFALFLHATPLQIGILSSLPQLIGTLAQLLSVKALSRVPRKPLILLGAAGQAALWLPIFSLPLLFPRAAPWLLIALATIHVAMGHFAIPAWNSLITDFVVPNGRGVYFAQRARFMAIASFCALFAAGLLLDAGRSSEAPWIGFALIFLVAAVARSLSTYCLTKIDDPVEPTSQESSGCLFDFLGQSSSRDFRRFLLFSGLMHVCVLIAGPFFVIYLLRDLHFNYLQYAAWLAAGTFGQFIALTHWGRISDRFGNKWVIEVTGWSVPFLPMLYLLSTNLAFLLTVNFLGGVIWAGMTLGLQNYVFDAVPSENKAKGVAVTNAINAAGWIVGALIGSWLTVVTPLAVPVAYLPLEAHPVSNLPIVFLISGLLRLVVSAGLLGTFREPRAVEPVSPTRLIRELARTTWLVQLFSRKRSHA